MKKGRIRIMIVDDHQMVRETWKTLLQVHDIFEIIGECDNGTEAIEMSRTLKPDIILMDINMYPVNGFDATREIIQFFPEARIIGLSVNDQPVYVRKLLQLGGKGYVTKHSTSEEMVIAIHEVIKGNTYICREIKNKMGEGLTGEDDKSIL